MDSRFTRRRFLTAAGAAAAYLALTPTVGCQPPEHSSKVRSSRDPNVEPLPDAPFPQDGVWAFRSRPDLDPPVVEVITEAHDDTAPGYIFVAPEKGGTGKGGSMIIDDRGQVVWFHPL
ncbi:MAG TPA: twin-arginine translocation signal domain-containing protein, partial [Rubrobacter sp.]|nr:twin-arginine translocation signal domain-containing protein [Rubrobacter sp.]